MALSVNPNQMIAAGTHATEGSDCSPEINGWSPRRSGRTRVSRMPRGVAMITDRQNPSTARCRLPQIAFWTLPCDHSDWIVDHTSAGAGPPHPPPGGDGGRKEVLGGGLPPACHSPTSATVASSGGTTLAATPC